MLAGEFAVHVACLAGLAERHLFVTAGTMFDEAADLPGPDGAAELYRLVAQGELGDEARIVAALERVWAGLETWVRDVALTEAVRRRCVAGER